MRSIGDILSYFKINKTISDNTLVVFWTW